MQPFGPNTSAPGHRRAPQLLHIIYDTYLKRPGTRHAGRLDQHGGRRAGAHPLGYGSPSKLALAAAGGLAPSVATGSVLDRLGRLERRADALAEMGAKAEVRAAAEALGHLLQGQVGRVACRCSIRWRCGARTHHWLCCHAG